MERPLRLNFQASPERLARLDATKEIARLKQEEAAELRAALGALDPERRYHNRETFLKDLKSALASRRLKLAPALLKAVLLAFAERDQTCRCGCLRG